MDRPTPGADKDSALSAGEELAAYAFIRAWMADDVDKGMLLIEQHHVPKEAALFVMSLVQGRTLGAALRGRARRREAPTL
jgi:hypothetical protein